MKQEIYNKFHAYLCDVCKHYQENKSLRHFSQLAAKHGCTKITTQQFFENSLHLVAEPKFIQSCIIRDIIAGKDRERREEKANNNQPTLFDYEKSAPTL